MSWTIPTWARRYLDQNAFEQIEQAIASAESRTTGEIVPMLVRRSSTMGHVPITIFLLTWLACEVIDVAHWVDPTGGHWAWEAVYCVVALASAALLAPLPFVQRWLIPADDRAHQVDTRAELEFFEAGMTETKDRTGVIIFISLMEHRVTVLADEGIAAKFAPETWSGVVAKITASLKNKDLATGLCAGISQCGDLLAEHFPRAEDTINELHDHLIIKE